jgi:pectin methylesterase-like acyl-CoA thioesterase
MEIKTLLVGLGQPFPTIQAAIDSLPVILDEDTRIQIQPGEYKEDVKITNVRGKALVIEGIKREIDRTSVMNIRCYDVQGLIKVNNLRFVWSDQVNKTTTKSVLLFSRCSYASLDNLKFLGKTKTSRIPTIQFDGSLGSVHNSYFHNQKTCIYSKNGSQIRVDDNNTHSTSPSNYFLFAQAAIIHYAGSVTLPCGTRNKEYRAGKIFT